MSIPVRVLGKVMSVERVWCGEDDRCTRVQMLVTVPGRPPFTTSHLVPGEKIVEVGTSIPVDVHPTRNLFRLAPPRDRRPSAPRWSHSSQDS
jgi:hypothetical protein